MYIHGCCAHDFNWSNERNRCTLRFAIFIRDISYYHRAFLFTSCKILPPVVTGSVVTIIGINLMPVAMNYLAGGQGAKDYGDVKNILLGLMTLIIILVLQRFTTGFIKSIAILIGLF